MLTITTRKPKIIDIVSVKYYRKKYYLSTTFWVICVYKMMAKESLTYMLKRIMKIPSLISLRLSLQKKSRKEAAMRRVLAGTANME